MNLDNARGDVVVAAVVAGCTVALTLLVRLGVGTDPGVLVRASPIVVYLIYLFSRKGAPDVALDTPRNWSILALLVTVAALVYALTI